MTNMEDLMNNKDKYNEKDKDNDNCKNTHKEQPQRLVAFVTLVTFLRTKI